jgi:AcrR family transcriptional regulator
MGTIPARLSGRQAQAARNDQRILDAARAVFTADPGAPIAAVAERAGVGMSALYRRYPSKDELLQRLSLDTLGGYLAAAEAALADEGDPWNAFAGFMRRALEVGTGALTVRFAGAFTAGDELRRLASAAYDSTQRLVGRTKAAGALRQEIGVADLSLIFEQLQAVRTGDEVRAHQLRHRYLALLLDALHAAPRSSSPLPGPPPTWDEISRRYDT